MDDAGVTIEMIRSAYKSQAWPVFGGLIVTLLVGLSKRAKLLEAINAPARRWVALALAAVGAAGLGLAVGAGPLDVLGAMITAALGAVGIHEYSKGKN